MARLIMAILWPSFLVAIVAEGFFFSLFDPRDIAFGNVHVEMTPQAVYSIGFFCFWAFCGLASMLSCYLLNVPDDRGRRVPF